MECDVSEIRAKAQDIGDLDFVKRLDEEQIRTNPLLDIAARPWEEDRYNAAKILYKSMRVVDDLVDDCKPDAESVTETEKQQIISQINNSLGATGNPSQQQLIETLAKFQIPSKTLQKFTKSMIYDIDHNGFRTFSDFLGYAGGAAAAPASLFAHFCGLKIENGGYQSPQFDIEMAEPLGFFCYMVHIVRDFQDDQINNLNYFADDLMAESGVDQSKLRAIAAAAQITPEFRDLMGKYRAQADKYRLEAKRAVDEISVYLEPRYKLSLELLYDLYLQIFERIDVDNGSFTTAELNPTPDEVKARVDEVISRFA